MTPEDATLALQDLKDAHEELEDAYILIDNYLNRGGPVPKYSEAMGEMYRFSSLDFVRPTGAPGAPYPAGWAKGQYNIQMTL